MKSKSSWVVPILVFFTVFVVYVRCPCIATHDSRWVIPTAISIVKEGNTDLDEYKAVMLPNDYAISKIGGHLYNLFPIGTSIISVPFVFAIDQTGSRLGTFDLGEYVRRTDPQGIELFIASFVTALTAVFTYFMARLFLGVRRSLLLVSIFAFCTSAWSVASRALWQHGPSMLMLTIALYLILLARDRPHLIQFAGVPLAFSYVVRPTNAISCLLLTVFVLFQYRNYFVRYLLWAMTVGIPFLLYNFAVYHSMLAPYYQVHRLGTNPHLWEALAGNLLSPARGLFVFTPILLFSVVEIAWRISHQQLHKLDWILVSAIFLHWVSISSYKHWWAGYSFGPRLFSDIIPYFMYFLILAIARVFHLTLGRKIAVASVFLCLTVASFAIHFRGATDLDTFAWNATPIDVDIIPARVWDWYDIQFLRSTKALDPQGVRLPKWQRWFVPNKSGAVFGNTFQLLGYRLSVHPYGSSVAITLYWQALQQPDFDYSVFVHLIDEADRLVAQKDQAPGAVVGYPPTAWQVGDIVEDDHVIEFPAGMGSGTYHYHFRVGVYNWATGERLQARLRDNLKGDSVVLDCTLSH